MSQTSRFDKVLTTIASATRSVTGLRLGVSTMATPAAAAASASASHTPAPTSATKSVKRVLPRPGRHWVGDGFNVLPVFHDYAFTEEISPWLMFDYGPPEEFKPTTERRGVGQHPHRGFETITVMLRGEGEHRDSVGNQGVIGEGDVQWMTAGRGIIHEEYHSSNFAKTGGTMEMAQLWLNLPAKHKMTAPKYQPIIQKQIPHVPLVAAGDQCKTKDNLGPASNAVVKVIAGEFGGVRGPATTFSPVELWNVDLGDLTAVPYELAIPDGHNCIVFVRYGGAKIGSPGQEQHIPLQGVALLHREGSVLRVLATEPGTQLLVMAGEPLNEPIANMGPFVMNTREELLQAQVDFRSGRMGQ